MKAVERMSAGTRSSKFLVRLWILCVVISVAAGCSTASQQKSSPEVSVNKLVFLTREGCVNTATMREHLDTALKALGLPRDYQFIDVDTLPASDPRGGYGTPTILYENGDLFGMPEPRVPHSPPT